MTDAGHPVPALPDGGNHFSCALTAVLIGRAVWPHDVDSPDALLTHADAAMYDVKRARS